jgi:hypothetical protein
MEQVVKEYLQLAKISRKQSYRNLATIRGCRDSAAEGGTDTERNCHRPTQTGTDKMLGRTDQAKHRISVTTVHVSLCVPRGQNIRRI